jgi:integrase
MVIQSHFGQWSDKQLTDINEFLFMGWRKKQLKKGRTAGGVNRLIAYLRALLNHAYRVSKVIKFHPLANFKQLKEDKKKVARFLSEDEEKRLRKAMVDRDNKAIIKRNSANEWRRQRRYHLLTELPVGSYSDHLSPIVLLDLNTGLRRGELFNLDWSDIDFNNKKLVVQGTGVKAQGLPRMKGFWFHCLRHTFASNLVMKGVPLNTVRVLMGHSDMELTMRYAHLASNHLSDAVNLLN